MILYMYMTNMLLAFLLYFFLHLKKIQTDFTAGSRDKFIKEKIAAVVDFFPFKTVAALLSTGLTGDKLL